jgi:hypothetical protein
VAGKLPAATGWQAVPPNCSPMIVGQSSGHFSRPEERFSVRHYRYFFTISQHKPRKRNFHKKYFFDTNRNSAIYFAS